MTRVRSFCSLEISSQRTRKDRTMRNTRKAHEAIKDHALNNQNIESYTKYSTLVVEDDQIFVQFDGVPKRGSLTVWIELPVECRDDDWEPLGHVWEERITYADDSEPRTIGFLRGEIDDLDKNIRDAKTTLAAIHRTAGASSVPDYMVTFMKLTVANSEDLRRRLFKELEELTDDVLDHLDRKNTN
ncbi:hypothetical protein SEA_ATUIN_233 [Arthrobacter phage Atuin]|nr:hypothetical protein SEA_ATUIN_32 [Arthrobacter phage Atuin]